jgi:hypothetical protein
VEAGVARVFHPGASLDDIVATVRALTATRRAAENAEKVPGTISISQEVPGTFST